MVELSPLCLDAKAKLWLPDTLLVALEMLKMFSVAPCVMPPSPLL